jgi:hypothetical protein
METLNSISQVASKVLWGEGNTSTEEPVAGQQGAGTATEPFDKGNEDTKTGGGKSCRSISVTLLHCRVHISPPSIPLFFFHLSHHTYT